MLLNYPSRFEVQMSRMVIMISLFGRVRFTHLSDLEKKVEFIKVIIAMVLFGVFLNVEIIISGS